MTIFSLKEPLRAGQKANGIQERRPTLSAMMTTYVLKESSSEGVQTNGPRERELVWSRGETTWDLRETLRRDQRASGCLEARPRWSGMMTTSDRKETLRRDPKGHGHQVCNYLLWITVTFWLHLKASQYIVACDCDSWENKSILNMKIINIGTLFLT